MSRDGNKPRLRRWLGCAGIGALALIAASCESDLPNPPAAGSAPASATAARSDRPLYVCALPASPPASPLPVGHGSDPVIIPECRLTVVEKEDVPGQQDGFLLFIGTEIRPGDQVSPDRLIHVQIGDEMKQFRRLKEDDPVEAGQLLGQIDDRLARNEWQIKSARVAASRADLAAAQKAREEAQRRYETQLKLQTTGGLATSEEEIRAARLAWEKAHFEVINKQEALTLAQQELNQAQTMLQMYEVRSRIAGVVRTILKSPGEAIRRSEAVLQVQNLSRLRAEGFAPVECMPHLRTGMHAIVEAAPAATPDQSLQGHLQEVTGIAITKDQKNPRIVSSGQDGTVRIWDRTSRQTCRILHHPAPVRAVACTGPGAAANKCLSGCTDGIGRIWDLDSVKNDPVGELRAGHQGPITCVAFSPDGQYCATGGEDRGICIWSTKTAQMQYRLPTGHRGAVTSVQFTPRSQFVSAGRDNTLQLWDLREHAAFRRALFDHRTGEVTQLEATPDGNRLLLDQGQGLRLLGVPDGQTDGLLSTGAEGSHFTTFARFSPDGRMIATTGASENRLQLWRTPTANQRGAELRQLVLPDNVAATCGAFAPDGSFLAAGTNDHQVLVWSLPPHEEMGRALSAEITRVERAVESSAGQVRVWAELANPDLRLFPGTTVTLVVDPGG